jgi:hypothetical protein
MKKILFIGQLFFLLTILPMKTMALQWYSHNKPMTYTITKKTDPVVEKAIEMWLSDMMLVTNQMPQRTEDKPTCQFIQLDRDKSQITNLRKRGIPVDSLIGKHDAFCVKVTDGSIVVVGSNGRGTAYGILEVSRIAGVSPWVWWGDALPFTRSSLYIEDDYFTLQSPSVDYRGIFINDEDWSLREWSSKTFEPTGTKGSIGPRTYKEIFKLLLRLRANTIWPAMHEGTTGFFTVKGNKEIADSFGILIGTSHCEPLLRNNVAEWNIKEMGPYNYMTNRKRVQQYWAERLREVKGSEELFTIGMRGIHDGSMEGVKSAEEKLNGLQQVIDDQRELIRKYYNKNVEQVPQVFIPYKEVLEIMESGLRVPDDVTLMWCDDNYGYLTRLPDAEQQKRSGGGGVYYHLSYWGRPHDHLWLTTTQPGLIYSEMRAAYDHNCRRVWIANVHDPKVAAYDLELFLDLAWDINSIVPNPSLKKKGVVTIEEHLEHWLMTQFGGMVGKAIAPAMREFYRLNSIRRPEFMGWTQVELDKKKYPGGKSLPSSTEFTLTEAYRRMADFAKIEAVVDVYAQLVRDHKKDAYFAHVLYPVHAAAAMTRKMLSHEKESQQAYEEIQQLTSQYNDLNGGKWRGLMSAAPRSLPVFAKDVRTELPQHPCVGRVIARNACSYDGYSAASSLVKERADEVSFLGHSMSAVMLPKGSTLTYDFTTDFEGEALLYTAMIPTQPSDRGDLRYEVRIDDGPSSVISLKEPFRSEQWKQNVLRGQALKKTPVTLTKGKHKLHIKALDHHIIVDQWMITQQKAEFYEIPVKKGK